MQGSPKETRPGKLEKIAQGFDQKLVFFGQSNGDTQTCRQTKGSQRSNSYAMTEQTFVDFCHFVSRVHLQHDEIGMRWNAVQPQLIKLLGEISHAFFIV